MERRRAELPGAPYESETESRKPASFAVALYCGMGSSSLKALVNAFDRLHSVRGRNSSYCGSFPPVMANIARDHGVANRLNAASSYRRPHFVSFVAAQSLHGQQPVLNAGVAGGRVPSAVEQTGLRVYGLQEAG